MTSYNTGHVSTPTLPVAHFVLTRNGEDHTTTADDAWSSLKALYNIVHASILDKDNTTQWIIYGVMSDGVRRVWERW